MMNKVPGLFLACCVLPLIAAWVVLWSGWQPESTTNQGSFLSQEVILDVPEQGHNAWFIALNQPENCGQLCQGQLAVMEQLTVALGKHRQQVGLLLIGQGQSEVADVVPEVSTLSPGAFYLVDKRGLVVLEYLPQPDQTANRVLLKGLLKDLKKLLSYERSSSGGKQ
ncbi:transmembrane cytochrome oxidase associated protein [Pseudoalteromonas sp. OOF1S-7]|uniref:transmembrane cytochrome oxidase associated protein n=1 Tax=Pseudoalteromonas sp. OOF1S-7 TaxID=2917757 RepID=UPI001EF53755|nr:transmembrane cytochrome oxidase associated protein [Pseudoalteromonas sp. OOF1S-7]MCG7537788.1 transmembrane cytochrome oxidase associated protein [Pseudoalteromonas sp. OOF1S-7]